MIPTDFHKTPVPPNGMRTAQKGIAEFDIKRIPSTGPGKKNGFDNQANSPPTDRFALSSLLGSADR